MGGLVMRWLASAGAIAIVAWLLPGISAGAGTRGAMTVLVTALVLGLVNAIVKPALQLLSCPLVLLTLGLFLFVINAAMLLLAGWLTRVLGFDFRVDGLANALIGSILISIVTWFLTLFVGHKDRKRKPGLVMDSKVMMGLALLFAGIMDLVMAIFMPRRIPDPAKQRIMRHVLGSSGAIMLVLGTLLAVRLL